MADLRSGRPVSQIMVAVFLSGVFEMAFVTPFGKFDPSRLFSDAANHVLTAFSLASGRDSMEMDALATELRARIDWVKDRLRQMATAMDGAGTPIDPVHEPNLVVLGELILCSVDWTLPARELAAMLSATGLIAFSMDFRGLEASDHASAGLERDAAAFRKAQRIASGHSHIVQPHAGGGKRRSGRRGLAGDLRSLWPEFRMVFPDASYYLTWQTWGNSERTPGGWLRTKTNNSRPTQDRLRRIFRDLANPGDI